MQQRMMHPRKNAQQQKMMMYMMMPAVFTFMMLFCRRARRLHAHEHLAKLPESDAWLLVERYLKAKTASPSVIESCAKETEGGGGKPTSRLEREKHVSVDNGSVEEETTLAPAPVGAPMGCPDRAQGRGKHQPSRKMGAQTRRSTSSSTMLA
jgi:hypothetical protein